MRLKEVRGEPHCEDVVLAGWGQLGRMGGQTPWALLSPVPSLSCLNPQYFGAEGSPQPVWAREGAERVVATRAAPAPSLDADLSILGQLLCQGVAVLGGSFSQVRVRKAQVQFWVLPPKAQKPPLRSQAPLTL